MTYEEIKKGYYRNGGDLFPNGTKAREIVRKIHGIKRYGGNPDHIFLNPLDFYRIKRHLGYKEKGGFVGDKWHKSSEYMLRFEAWTYSGCQL